MNMASRRKFRSQTSDNMDRWKAEQGRGREKRKIKRKKSKKKEDADARKGRKVAKHCVFPMVWGSGGSKSRLAKAAGAEPAGQMRDQKLHAVVARSTFPSQNVQNTSASDHFWKLRCRKSARRCGAKHISKSKCTKHTTFGPFWKFRCRKSARRCGAKHISKTKCTKHLSVGPLLEVEMSKKCTLFWREAHFEIKMLKTLGVRTTFGGSDVVSRGRRKGLCTSWKWAKREGFVAFPKTMVGMGHLKMICKDAFSVAGAIQKTCSWEMLGGQGADFLRGVAFRSIRCAGLLRWFCVTGAALRMTWHQFSVAGAVL